MSDPKHYLLFPETRKFISDVVHTITLGGSACAHSVNSGRHAAINAKKYIEG